MGPVGSVLDRLDRFVGGGRLVPVRGAGLLAPFGLGLVALVEEPTQLPLELGVGDGVDVGVGAAGRLAEQRRDHGHVRGQILRLSQDPEKGHDCVRRPRDEPQGDHKYHHSG